jgi:hypothetical protein
VTLWRRQREHHVCANVYLVRIRRNTAEVES